MATALKLRSDIKKLKKALESKGISASIKTKLKSQLDKAETELSSIQKTGKAPKKSSTAKTKTVLSAVQKLANRKRYSVYKGAGVDLKKDAEVGAMPTGKRISKGLKSNQHGNKSKNKGNVYYEYRANRLDVKQPKKKQTYPKLEDGGYMADGGIVKNFIIQRDNGEEFVMYKRSIDKHKLTKYPIEAEIFKSMEDAEKRIERYDLEKKLGVNLVVAKVTKSHPDGLMEYLQEYDEFASGGSTKGRYKINVYFGGEMEDEVLYANTIEEARKMANRGEHSEIYDSVTRKFVYASGGSVKSGESVPYIIWVSKDDDKREFHGEYKSKRAAEMAMNKLWDSGEYQSMGNKPKSMYEKEGFYAKGGKLNAGHKIKYQGKDAKIVSQKGDMYFVEVMNYHPNGDSMFTVLRAEEIGKFAAGGYMADGGKVKFEVDDVVYHKGHNTIGIVRMAEERGEVKTDADGNVNVDELEYYNPIKHSKHQSAKIAPSTKKEIEDRKLWKPFSDRTSQLANGGYVVRNLGGDRYDGGLAYEITKDGKVVQEGLLDGEMPVEFEGKSYDGLLALSEGIGAKMEFAKMADDYYAAGGEVILMEDYYGKSARVPLGFDVFTVEWQGDRPLKDNVFISDNGFRTLDKNSALFSQVYLTLLKAMKENKVKVMKDGGYMAHGGQIKAGQYVIVDNPYWKAAMGVEKPVRRRVKMVDGENVFFSDGSNSSIQYVKKLQEGGFLADGGILSNTHKLA